MNMNETNRHNIVLTGIPRSGTTLSCHLLNKVVDTVALHEPIVWERSTEIPDHAAVCKEIDDFFHQMRRSLLETQSAISKQRDGNVPDNPMDSYRIGSRWVPNRLLNYPLFRRMALRASVVSRGDITVSKPLSAQFNLCIKHTGPFTVLLDMLLLHHRCYAIIRNPLAVLLSWNSINFALYNGHMIEAEWLDSQLARQLAQISDRIDRQIALLSWFYARYDAVMPPQNLIRYEDIVASGGRALQTIVPPAKFLDEPLDSKNRNSLYDQRLAPLILDKLLSTDGAYWKFYTKESVQSLC